MKMTQYFGGGILVAVIVGLVGCADKNLQDQRDALAKERYAQLQPAQGTYRGTIASLQDGSPRGVVSLTLVPDMEIQTSSDNLGYENTPVLRGSLSYDDGLSSADVVFNKSEYNKDSGLFKATIPATDSTGATYGLDIQGTITETGFSGSMSVDNYPSYGVSMSLVKNGPVVPVPALSASNPRVADEVVQRNGGYIANYTNLVAGRSGTAKLVLQNRDTTPSEKLLAVFLPQRSVDVSISFVNADGTGKFQDYFAAASLDDLRGKISATNNTTDSTTGHTYHENLECTRSTQGVVMWSCTYTGSAKNWELNFIPASKNR